MRFRLTLPLWLMSLVASGLAAFGGWGLLACLAVGYCWAFLFALRDYPRTTPSGAETGLLWVMLISLLLTMLVLLGGLQHLTRAENQWWMLSQAIFTFIALAPVQAYRKSKA